jgi:hypothetical protein
MGQTREEMATTVSTSFAEIDDVDELSLDELRNAWVDLGDRLASRGEQWIRTALKCAFLYTVDHSDVRRVTCDREFVSFMKDVGTLLANEDGRRIVAGAVRSFDFPKEVALEDPDEPRLRLLCERMFANLVAQDVYYDFVRAMYSNARPTDIDDHAPGLCVSDPEWNNDLRTGMVDLSVAASEIIARGPSLANVASMWCARMRVHEVYRPDPRDGLRLIFWAARRLLPERSMTSVSIPHPPAQTPDSHQTFCSFIDVITFAADLMATRLGVPLSEAHYDAAGRRVRFRVPGTKRVMWLRVRFIQQGAVPRVEVCLVSVKPPTVQSLPAPVHLELAQWNQASQVFTGFKIPIDGGLEMLREPIARAIGFLSEYATSSGY